MSSGRLTIAATPIGNLGDVSNRLTEALSEADLIYAEDTRRTAKLLAHLGVSTPLRSLFSGNESERSAELVGKVMEGLSVVLVSDAGMPTVSDPGSAAVRRVREAGIAVTVVPGPSAVTAAVALSGFDVSRFVFEGFLPRKGRDRSTRIDQIAEESRAVVLFASPKRLGSDLADLASQVSSERRVAVVREMTKLHEEVWVGSLAEAVAEWTDEAKGEVTVVIDAAPVSAPDLDSAVDAAKELLEQGVSVSEAARRVAGATGVSRRLIYEDLVGQTPS